MSEYLTEITNDLYDVAQRLRSVNENYRVYYNRQLNRYEVRNGRMRGELDFIVPYGELDARTVDYALYSRVENAENIFAEAERNNESLLKTEE